jgi:hypothetical protein
MTYLFSLIILVFYCRILEGRNISSKSQMQLKLESIHYFTTESQVELTYQELSHRKIRYNCLVWQTL